MAKKRKDSYMKKKALPIVAVIGLILIIIAIMLISQLVKKYTPTKERQDLAEHYGVTAEDQVALILNNDFVESQGKVIDGHIYLDYNFVHDNLNSRFYWDANENVLLYTTASDLITASADSSSYTVTKSSNDFGHAIVKASSDSAYIDIDFIKNYTALEYRYFESPSRVVLTNTFGEVTTATSKKKTEVRVLGGIKSPILSDVAKGDTLTVVAPDTKWTEVLTADGVLGYIRSNALSNTTTETVTSDFTPDEFSHIKKDYEISMGWHQVTNKSANNEIANILSNTKGMNVISPTWFYLNDNNGNIADLASTSYVNYCHQQNVEVWALISNLENKDVDCSYVLTHTSTRQNLVNQIVSAAIQYNLDGINLDFEALDEAAVGDSFIQFVRELSLKCANNGIVLSIDNYSLYSFNEFYNRTEQANFADYIVLMGYDEHYAGSEEGSVASLNWVKEEVANTLTQVPAEQLILGMPFYTRVWSETPTNQDAVTEENSSDTERLFDLDSYACGMSEANKLVNANGAVKQWLDDCGQNYVEYVNNDVTYKIWLEDASSIEQKCKVVDENSLAGAAFWKLGLETSDTWDTIIKYIN